MVDRTYVSVRCIIGSNRCSCSLFAIRRSARFVAVLDSSQCPRAMDYYTQLCCLLCGMIFMLEIQFHEAMFIVLIVNVIIVGSVLSTSLGEPFLLC